VCAVIRRFAPALLRQHERARGGNGENRRRTRVRTRRRCHVRPVIARRVRGAGHVHRAHGVRPGAAVHRDRLLDSVGLHHVHRVFLIEALVRLRLIRHRLNRGRRRTRARGVAHRRRAPFVRRVRRAARRRRG